MPVNDQEPTAPLDPWKVRSQQSEASLRPARQQMAEQERWSALGTLSPPPGTLSVPPEARRPLPQQPRQQPRWRTDVWQWDTWSEEEPSRATLSPDADATSQLSVPAEADATSRIMPPNGHGYEGNDRAQATQHLPRRMAQHPAARREDLEDGEEPSRRRPPAFLVAAASMAILTMGATVALAITERGPFGGSRVELDSSPAATPDQAGLAPQAQDEPGTEGPAEPGTTEEPPVPTSHTVTAGDTLESVAVEYGLEWRLLFDANPEVEFPDLLLEGQVLKIPHPDADLPRRELPEPPEPEPEEAARDASDTSRERVEEPPPDEPPASTSSIWESLAQCESGGNWSIDTGNGYYGGLQFSLSSWQAVGGDGVPSEHSREEQIQRGEILRARQGWGAWPSCARKLGLL